MHLRERVTSADSEANAPDPPAAVAEGPPRGATLDGRYVIGLELGRGGMGRVFAARDLKLGRDVAIKVVSAGAHDPAQLARLAKEAHTAGSLAHPNIVAIHDVGAFAGGPYLVQELLRGETLRERLRRGPLSPERALDLAVQLARGLTAAHEQGVVHRDIKPDNLFVSADSALKILDFGIAILQPAVEGPRTWSAPPGPGTFAGTPSYMSPEQIQGRPTDVRSDLFSFGSVLHEMLSGERAFDRDTAVATAFAVLHDLPAPLPSAVPRSLERITLRCLEKDPAARFASARDLTAALEACQGDLGRPAHVRRRVVLVAAAGLALTLIVAVLLSVGRTRSQPEFRQLTFQRGAVWSARFAPDGKTVYYTVTEDVPTPSLYSTTVGRPEPQRIDVPPANLLAVSSTGEMALLLRPQIARYGFNRGVLARYLPGSGAPREVLEDVEYADWSPDGSGLALVRTVPGRTRLEYPAGHVLFQTTGWISFPRFAPDGRQIAFLHHPTPVEAAGVLMVTDLSGSARTLTPSWRYIQGLAWAKRGSEVWFTAAAANAPSANLVLRAVDLQGGEGRVLTQAGGNLELLDVAPDGRALLLEVYQRLGLAVLSSGEAKARDRSWFDQTFVGDLSADGKRVLFTVEGGATGNVSVVYLRNTDGSAPVRLGLGYGVALSPDGRWAISLSLASGPLQPLTFLPTGAGEPKTLDAGGVSAIRIRWFADGKRLLIAGLEPEHGLRLYVRSVDGGKPRAISEEGVHITGLAISRDGRFAAAGDPHGRTTLYPVDGGDPVPLPEVEADEVALGFGDDGSLFVGRLRPLTVPVYRLDLRTRVRTPIATLVADAPGALGIVRVASTPDGATFAFNYASVSSNLYALEGSQ
jgi:Tol biopolymer transport system component